jgi:UPF0755 protein
MLKTVLIYLVKILFILLSLVVALIVFSIGGGYWLYQYVLQAPLPLKQEWHYTLAPKTNLYQVAKDLKQQELINYPTAITWIAIARLQKKAHRIKAGEYAITIGTTPQQLLDILVKGKSIQYALTIPEGWNFNQLMAAVNEHPYLSHTLAQLDKTTIMHQLGWSDQHPEGRFYPDTYYFPKGMTDVAFLKRAYRLMASELKKAWAKRQTDLPLKTPYEALILASLIEKETAVAAERPLIAGVFTRRLKKGIPLQTDPTVIYALGKTYDGNIRQQDLKLDNPYNTYVYKGLPPTPIAMPGRSALQAAVNPTPGDTLYFVAKGDGSHYFSASYSEHACAVIEYQLKRKAPRLYRSRCHRYPNCDACRS